MARQPYRQSRDPFVWIIGAATFSVLLVPPLVMDVVRLRASRLALTAQHNGERVHLASIRFGGKYSTETTRGTYTVAGDPHTWNFLTWDGGAWAGGRFPYGELTAATADAYQECRAHDQTGGNSRGGLVVLYYPPARFIANLG